MRVYTLEDAELLSEFLIKVGAVDTTWVMPASECGEVNTDEGFVVCWTLLGETAARL